MKISSILFVMLLMCFLISCSKPAEKTAEKQQPQSTGLKLEPQGGSQEAAGDAGTGEVYSPLQSHNKLPIVKKAELVVDSADSLHVIAEGEDEDGDPVDLQYAWFVNDEKTSEEASITGLKKNDKVMAQITPFDGKQLGQAKALFMVIQNLPPVIQESAAPEFNDDVWTHRVVAKDPEEDPLTYDLVKGPSGMVLDPATGAMRWNTSGSPAGKYSATVTVTDTHGGITEYSFDIELKDGQ